MSSACVLRFWTAVTLSKPLPASASLSEVIGRLDEYLVSGTVSRNPLRGSELCSLFRPIAIYD